MCWNAAPTSLIASAFASVSAGFALFRTAISSSAPPGAPPGAGARSRPDRVAILPRREPDRDVRSSLDRKHRLHEIGRPARDAVHVERRVGERTEVELLGGARGDRNRAVVRELVGAGRPGSTTPRAPRGRRRRSFPELVGKTPVRAGKDAGERRDQGVRRVERRRPEQPRVHVRRPGANADVEVEHPADADRERRLATAHHGPVEDQGGVRPALVRRDPFHDRFATDLLLAVERASARSRAARPPRRAGGPPRRGRTCSPCRPRRPARTGGRRVA